MKLIMKAIGAATVLSAVLVALPMTLVKMVGYPLPTVMPSWDQISLAIDLGHVESTTIFKALACVLWLVWAWFLVIATCEAVAHMQGRRGAGTSRRVNPAHQIIARLVTSLAVVLTSMVSRSTVVVAEPAPLPAIELVSDLVTTPTVTSTESLEVSTPQTQATALDSGAPTWTVRHRDSLWRIADRALGDGARWREIYELNRDVIGPEPTRITKDMTLVLPPGATVVQPTTASSVHVVVPGDTLSQIAANALGDPGRFDELFEFNVDKTQPDGAVLRDPNLIRPGWSLDIPTTGLSDSNQEIEEVPQPSAPVVEGDVAENPKTLTDTTTAPAPNTTKPLAPLPVNTPATETRSEQSSSPTQETKSRFPLGGMVVGLPVLAGAGLLVRLKMLRRNQMRHHLPGRLVVTPPPTCEPLERHIRALSPDDSLSFLDAALRLLTRSLRENSTMKVPSVWGVQLGDGGVELLLEHANTTPPPGFLALHNGWSWALDPTLSLIDLTALVEGELPALVGLIGIGQTSEGSVFLNVEHCGVFSVEGDATRVETFLMGCALDLATPTWVQGMVSVLASDTVGELALLEDVELIDNSTEALTKLATEAQSSARALGTRSVMTARGQSNDVWPLKVFISKTLGDGNDVQAADLSQLANAQAGAAVITSGEIPDVTWRLS
ncbi:MAG: LysM peptidoglycan-binding domain-containing protein, partial [Acidimicrobiales bacterium]